MEAKQKRVNIGPFQQHELFSVRVIIKKHLWMANKMVGFVSKRVEKKT